jgi:hypothetical protein
MYLGSYKPNVPVTSHVNQIQLYQFEKKKDKTQTFN